MLYVDAGNTKAVKLYDSLGFSLDHVDRAYVGDVGPQPTPDTPRADPTA
jgi:ribosomal protein S18 acetylase RimI-like enzyme